MIVLTNSLSVCVSPGCTGNARQSCSNSPSVFVPRIHRHSTPIRGARLRVGGLHQRCGDKRLATCLWVQTPELRQARLLELPASVARRYCRPNGYGCPRPRAHEERGAIGRPLRRPGRQHAVHATLTVGADRLLACPRTGRTRADGSRQRAWFGCFRIWRCRRCSAQPRIAKYGCLRASLSIFLLYVVCAPICSCSVAYGSKD